jgi:hypothetical protein
MSEDLQILKKLTMKTMGLKGQVVRKMEAGKAKRLAVVYGVAYGVTEGTSEIGGQVTAWKRLDGEFEGINLENGKRFRSNAAFLPGGLDAAIVGVLGKESVSCAQFAIEISAVNDESNERNLVGFFYTAKDLTQASAADPLVKLREIVAKAPQLQISAPTLDPVPEPAAPKTAKK